MAALRSHRMIARLGVLLLVGALWAQAHGHAENAPGLRLAACESLAEAEHPCSLCSVSSHDPGAGVALELAFPSKSPGASLRPLRVALDPRRAGPGARAPPLRQSS